MAKKKRAVKPKEYTRRQLSSFQRQKRRQRIIFFSGVSIIAAIIIIIVAGWYLGEYRPMHRTVIKVKDTEFNTAYYIDMLKIYAKANPSQQPETISQTLVNNIVQSEMIRQGAEALGVTVDDNEIKKALKEAGTPVSDAYVSIIRAQRLRTKLEEEYFSKYVPVSDNQVHMMAMLVESESVALEVRGKIISGDNFTALAREYGQNYYAKNEPYGDFGWHPETILKEQLGSMIPIDYAFGAEPGELSQPLSDNESYKQLGYWLIKVLSMSEEDEEADVQALFLSSRDEALEIKARLESGDNLSALADQYSQYSPSKENHGELGLITKPATEGATAVSQAFDSYVFNLAIELGKWSEPIKDTSLWTRGGCWLVKVIDKEDNRELSTEDRAALINKAYNEWVSQLWVIYSVDIDTSGLTPEVIQWAVAKVRKEM